jgi:tetraacyldisaccharide 4'-kinase
MLAPEFWHSKGLVSTLLAPFGWLWAIGARIRAGREGSRAPVPVICIGNLSVGGAGKTPVALAIARLLPGAQFLSKGYGGSEKGPLLVDPHQHSYYQVGDEPLLLSEVAPCWVAKDRVAGAEAAASAGARCLIMDDGFQDPSLIKTLSILVVDGHAGFGNGRCMPAGPLREPISVGLRRADAVVILGEDEHGIEERVAPLPVIHAYLEPEAEASVLRGRRVVAFAGIGRPTKFFDSLEDLGALVAEGYGFPDHHPYHPAEIGELQRSADAKNAILITTTKDSVRMPPHLRDQLAVLQMDVAFDDEDGLVSILNSVLGDVARS